MRLGNYKFLNVDLAKMFTAVSNVLSNVSRDNMVSVVIDDTTASSANTSKPFRHNLGVIPTIYTVLEGNAYVEYGSVTDQEIDVRSTNASETFKLLLIK